MLQSPIHVSSALRRRAYRLGYHNPIGTTNRYPARHLRDSTFHDLHFERRRHALGEHAFGMRRMTGGAGRARRLSRVSTIAARHPKSARRQRMRSPILPLPPRLPVRAGRGDRPALTGGLTPRSSRYRATMSPNASAAFSPGFGDFQLVRDLRPLLA